MCVDVIVDRCVHGAGYGLPSAWTALSESEG